MKGVILAGGRGTRMLPLTAQCNKHLLPVAGKPMIYWSIKKLVEAGIDELAIVTNAYEINHFEQALKPYQQEMSISFFKQHEPTGIASALSLTESFTEQRKMVVLLGDNLFADSLAGPVARFVNEQTSARIFLTETNHPSRYAVAFFNREGELRQIIEKPQITGEAKCVTGIYMYDASVYEMLRQIAPSERGEYELTDVNQLFLKAGLLSYECLEAGGMMPERLRIIGGCNGC